MNKLAVKTTMDVSNKTVEGDDGQEEEEFVDLNSLSDMFEEPKDFRPASPKPTKTIFKRRRREKKNAATGVESVVDGERVSVQSALDFGGQGTAAKAIHAVSSLAAHTSLAVDAGGVLDKEEDALLTVHLPPQHSLWAHKLWNAGQSLAHYIDANPLLVKGKRVLELGAAASLPSIISALNGAKSVVSTDYPDPVLIENIIKNAMENIPQLLDNGTFKVKGFVWGQVETIHELAEEGCFDLILLADVVFNHNQHENLLRSCKELLRSNGIVLTTYSHHVVKWADRDMIFFDIAKDMGFTAQEIYVEKWQEMFPEDSGSLDVRRTVYAWKLFIN